MKLKQQEAWDNSGLQIGDLNSDIKTVMLTLDVDLNAVNYAIENKVDLIITHHPFLFGSIKSIDYNTYDGKIIRTLITNNINLYSMHTSLDMAEKGINYQLANKLSIDDYNVLHKINADNSGYGGIGEIDAVNVAEFAEYVKKSLNCSNVKLYCSNKNKLVKKVAFCGGSGSEFIDDAINMKADVYITGDIKYHQAQMALKSNLCIIDAGHFYTENHFLRNLKDILDKCEGLHIILLKTNTVEEIII